MYENDQTRARLFGNQTGESGGVEIGVTGRWTAILWVREAACCRREAQKPFPHLQQALIPALSLASAMAPPRGAYFIYCVSPAPRGQRKSPLVCLQTLPGLSRCRADLQTVIALASSRDSHAGLSLVASRTTSPRQTAGQSPCALISQSAVSWLEVGKFKLNATKEP